MPVANDFLTWPRSFKEQRKKIPQDAAVQRVTNSSQTKYEAEDTLENDYNLLKQQVYIPAVWRSNSKGDHPTRKSTSRPPPRNWLRLFEGRTEHRPSPAPVSPRFCSLVHILLSSKEE